MHVYHIFFIYLCVDRHPGRFYFLPIVNGSVINMDVQVLCGRSEDFFGYISSSSKLGHVVVSVEFFKETSILISTLGGNYTSLYPE